MLPDLWEPGQEMPLPSQWRGSALAAPGSGAPRYQLAFSRSSPHLSPPLISHLLWSPYQPLCLSSHGPDVNPAQDTWTFYLQPAELTQRLLFLVNDIPGGASGKEPAHQCRRLKRCEVSSLGREESLEKSMTTHSSVLAWRTPWTGEWSTGSPRVGHNWSDLSMHAFLCRGLPDGSVVENPLASAGDSDSASRSGRSPGEGNGNLLQDSCLGNPINWGAWQATVHGVEKSRTRLNV